MVTGTLRVRQNRLGAAASGYLRSAGGQPVDWMEWGEEAFAQARGEDKPVLLDIGAVWCHWCHVMDRESYEDGATAAVINEHFVAVKVDRDERPDVDARYQAAVAAISGQGGWPLTAFLTPEGKPFFGGTYFPPVDGAGRPSFRRVLLTMAEAFQNRREEVEESAAGAMAAIEQNETLGARSADPGVELVEKLAGAAVAQFDPRFGGFGAQPKFPHAGALDLLIDMASRETDMAGPAANVALVTLDKMSKGGVYDQLGGGFHRYSVDERWVVPHFEKMAYDNAALLGTYVRAFQTFGEPECARVARDVMRWMDEWLTDRELGGFYASQDADVSLDDDGDYFTWTLAQARAVLTAEEMAVAGPFYDIGEIGDMRHNVAKNVLHVTKPLGAVAAAVGISGEAAAGLLRSARGKLYGARKLRATPYVDRTVYAGWNGMCVSAYLLAGRVLGVPEATAFGLKTLDRVLAVAWDGERLGRVVAYGEGGTGARVDGVLEDYGFLAAAALDAWEATGEVRYFRVAEELVRGMVGRFYDESGGGFFDTGRDASALGALAARRKPLQDSPVAAGNPVAAGVLVRMEALTGEEGYGAKAQATLECFAGVVEHLGLYAASYGLALRGLVEAPVQVCVVGEDGAARELEAAALRPYLVNKSVVRLTREQLGALPPALGQTLPFLPEIAGSFAVVCSGNTCRPPVRTVEDLRGFLD